MRCSSVDEGVRRLNARFGFDGWSDEVVTSKLIRAECTDEAQDRYSVEVQCSVKLEICYPHSRMEIEKFGAGFVTNYPNQAMAIKTARNRAYSRALLEAMNMVIFEMVGTPDNVSNDTNVLLDLPQKRVPNNNNYF